MAPKTLLQKPILIVQHAPHEHPAALKRALESQGLSTILVNIFENQLLPKSNDISGLISLGGPMGANDEIDYPWLLDEIALMRACFDKQIPTVGICLGGQMLARALGGKVSQNPHPEIGWFELQVKPDALKDPLFSATGAKPHFYQWHYDTFFPPHGAEILAESVLCERQAFKINDTTYGFQFHPEADHQLVDEWLNIEGTDEEILLARIAHHQDCVQLPHEHRTKAKNGENFSLNFVAAIGQLFSKEKYEDKNEKIKTEVETFMNDKSFVLLKIKASDEKIIPLAGTIEKMSRISQGDFVFFKERSTLVWPIRMDHVLSIELLKEY